MPNLEDKKFVRFVTVCLCEKGFPGGSVVKNLPAPAGDTGRSCEEGNVAGGNPLLCPF